MTRPAQEQSSEVPLGQLSLVGVTGLVASVVVATMGKSLLWLSRLLPRGVWPVFLAGVVVKAPRGVGWWHPVVRLGQVFEQLLLPRQGLLQL